MQAKYAFQREQHELEDFRRTIHADNDLRAMESHFTYRYYRNPRPSYRNGRLLTGGIGLSDLFYRHFEWFAGDFFPY